MGSTPLYKAEAGITTTSGKFVRIDVAKDKLDAFNFAEFGEQMKLRKFEAKKRGGTVGKDVMRPC